MLNQNTQIRISTRVGYSEYKPLQEILGQGTLGGAVVSGLNIDLDVMDYFEQSMDELSYGSVRLQPLLYQDDLLHLGTSREKVQAANRRIAYILKL